jgi:uncharacterized protein
MKPLLFLLQRLLAVSLFFFGGCAKQKTIKEDPYPEATLKIGSASVIVEVVQSPVLMSRGLMFRDSLPIGHGMLFIFDRPGIQSFWMKNTHIPLDIAYIDPSGTVLEIHEMFPHDTSGVYSTSDQVLYALEVPQGWFKEKGVSVGAKIESNSLKKALKAAK